MTEPVDVFYLLDTSKGVTKSQLGKMKDVVTQQANAYSISSDGVRMSVLTYDKEARSLLPVGRGTSVGSLKNALDAAALTDSPRQVENALQFVRRIITYKSDGARNDAGKVVVLMVAGRNARSGLPYVKSEASALKDSGASVVVIGMGDDLDENELKSVATKPDQFVKVSSEDKLMDAVSAVSGSISDTQKSSLKLDLGFILGADGVNADRDFALGKEAIKAMLRKLDISRDKTRFGLIVYGESAGMVSRLDSADSVDGALKVVDQVRSPRKGFALKEALEMARTDLLNVASGARRDTAKTAVIFVNKEMDPASKTAAEALRRAGVKILAVSLGEKDASDSLRDVTSSDEDIKRVSTRSDLDELTKALASSLTSGNCNVLRVLWHFVKLNDVLMFVLFFVCGDVAHQCCWK